MSAGRYAITLTPLPNDADQQREQLVRRLAAADQDIDIIGMHVIWTAEFAEAGWILPWPASSSTRVSTGRLAAAVEIARYKNRLWAAPFTSNAQLLWYRNDRVKSPPHTWNELIEKAETIGSPGTLQLQGQRYEGLTVFFISLLASAGGSVLDESGGSAVSLEEAPTLETLSLMENIAFQLRPANFSNTEIARRVNKVAAILELTPLLERKPASLSGGQRQRVDVGRTSSGSQMYSFWTNPFPIWTRGCGYKCASKSPVCKSGSARP